MKTESSTGALKKSRKNGLARIKLLGDRSTSNQPTTISVVELPPSPRSVDSKKRSPKLSTTDRGRSVGNYSDHSTKNADQISSKTTKKTSQLVVFGKSDKSENKPHSVYYYQPTFLEQMKSLQCLRVLRSVYHKYGLKHVILISILLGYSFLGAGIFLFLEKPAEQIRHNSLQSKLKSARRITVNEIIYEIFNDTQRFLIFLSSEQTSEVEGILQRTFEKHEEVVTYENFRHGYSEMHWDFSNSMLYAWTIITTIGYGYLHPTTDKGKVVTMIYAIFGIPLFLSVLNDLGKVLTRAMKYPFFLAKKYGRRLFQYCTRMSRDQIKEAEAKDKARLEVFDLPVPLAIGIVIGWIFICSAITLTWEHDWDYLIAFYFFFISLSTIGFGDVMPSDTRYLLIMFGNIVVGLALVSMCINLIQVKLEKTYHANSTSTPERRERSEESTDETSDTGGRHPKQSNGGLLKSFFKRAASQISLSALSSQSRQASQTSLQNYELTTPPLANMEPSSDEDVQYRSAQTPVHFHGAQPPIHFQGGTQTPMPKSKKYSKSSSPELSKKSSRASPTPSEPARHISSDTQTMLSIPSYQKGDETRVISVSSQRGTVRTLPSTTSFSEIDRIVDLNINAELLRNELIDLETYHNILSPQEVMAQIHQERKLHHV